MAGPTFARLARIENDPAYFTQLEEMYAYMKSTHALFDPERGLWYRDQTAKNRTGANTPEFWGRGNGWVIAACARVLEQLPPADPRRAEFVSMLQTMAAALLPLQGEDGFWRSNLLFPAHHPNPETSCTAFFTYALAYGINEGLLDSATYTPVVERAWQGMTTLALNSAGRLGYVQAIGAAPAPNNAEGQQDYGYGAFLLAGCEILRGFGGPAPITALAGADLTVTDTDADFAETIRLDASASIVRDGSSPRADWWLGPVFLGTGPTLDVTLPLGVHFVTVSLAHPDGRIYTDSLTIRVQPAPAAAVAASAIGHQIPNTPQNTLDGDLATRWSQEGAGQWIEWRLPVVATLDQIGLAFYLGDTRRSFFDLQLSLDGVAWETVFSGQSGGATAGIETFAFPARTARHIRYVGQGNSASAWNSLTEVDLPVARLLDSADSEANGLPDAWETHHFGATGQPPALLPAYVAGDASDAPLRVELDPVAGPRLLLQTRAALGPGYVGRTRRYRILTSPDLSPASWETLPGHATIAGDNLLHSLPVAAPAPRAFYRAEIWLE